MAATKWLACLLAALTLAGTAMGQDPKAEEPVPETIEALKAAITEVLEETGLPGLSIAMVTADEVLLADGLGLADVANNTPATGDTLFRIGSTSKAFTALAALKLRAEGRLDFNATLASLAPEIEFTNPWEDTDPVRIVHLLEHTSGFDDMHLAEYANHDPRPNNLKDALAFHPDSRVSRWRPGTRTSYCNNGPPLVAHVIEKITGQPFEDYVRENFFKPIGMQTATYFLPVDESTLTKLYKPDGKTPYPYWHISVRPSGSINASAHDMAAYLQFYLNRGRVGDTVVTPAADLDRMEHPESTLAGKEGLKVGYGLYNTTSPDDDGFIWHGHGGGVQGGGCSMSYMTEGGIGYAFMFNASNGGAVSRINKLVRGYLTKGLKKPTPPEAVAVPEDIAGQYAGFYIPTNPRSQWIAVATRVAGASRLRFEDGAAHFGTVLPPNTKRYVGVTPRLLRQENHTLASLALLETPDDGVSIAAGGTSMSKVSAVRAVGPLALAILATLMAVSTLLFLPVWGIRAWRGKINAREHLGLRLWPLAASVAMIAFVGGAVVMISDPEIFTRYSSLTLRSLALVSASVLFLLVPWAGLLALMRGSYQGAHRGLAWHATLVLLAIGLLALYLTVTGTIPFITWG